MTVNDEGNTSTETDHTTSTKKSDAGQNLLRAARAGNLQKVYDLLVKQNVDIHSCNANGLNALHLASKEGHFEVVKELLARGSDPTRATKKGNTALHIASLAGQFDVAKALLDAGALVNVQAQNGFTPLYMASQENHLEVVKLLLAHKANAALTTDDGFTPLAVALQQGHDRIVALLLENDSRGKVCLPALHIAAKKDDVKAASLLLNSDVLVDHQSASGFTPLHIAAHYGNISMTELLITRGANINFQAKNNITPLHVACKWGNHGVAERLIAAGAELDCRTRDGLTPLHCASRSGHDTVVDLLLNSGANFNSKTRSGLNSMHMASQGDHIDCVRILLQHGAPLDDTTIDYLTALHVAAHCGNARVAKLLLERGCEVNARALNGFTPLHVACQKNRIKVVELLLKHGALVEAATESGLTPLHVTSFMGHLSIAVLLMQHGANPNAPTVRSETALHLATRAEQGEVVRFLLRNGVHVDARARGHQTALHIAARLGNVDITTALLEQSAHVNAATKDNYTPLHLAARGNHTSVCQVLIKGGADLESITRSGFNPLHLAVKYSNIEPAQLLIQHGAQITVSGRNGLTALHLATHYGSIPLVRLLLDNQADPLAQAKNGYTPLHIAAVKKLQEVAAMLLLSMGTVNGCNVESRNGFTALHLASQSGSPEMTKRLLDSEAFVNARAKNGLTPMHLAAQEDSVKAAELLFTAGSELDARTKAGYTPLHTACHFGQINMVRFLLGKGVDVNARTCLGSNALHLAAQQGHAKVVYTLLESGANPNMRNKHNWTPAHVARRQHYLNIFEVLRQVTTCVESWEVEDVEIDGVDDLSKSASGMDTTNGRGYRAYLEQPDVMGDHPVTDTEEEYVETDFTTIPSSPMFSRALKGSYQQQQQQPISVNGDHTANAGARPRISKIASDKLSNISGEDSIHETGEHARPGDTMTNGVRESMWTAIDIGREFAELGGGGRLLSGWGMIDFPGSTDWDFTPDNVPIARKPITSGFLVSFLVDARGGSMRGSRHPGLRILVPPSAASAPTRITCRMLRQERTTRPPQLNDGEGLACRIIELGPHPCKFNSPVLLEIPHFASLRGRQRELVVLRSDNGETWREHSLEATDQAVQSALGQGFDSLETTEELREKRIIRILTNDFPQYLAIVSRLRQETAMIGSDGGVLSSTVVTQVQAVFPEGALQKRIRVGLQAHAIPTDVVSRLLGPRVSVSPIVTLEPRRRKFHKPITLTIPLPKTTHSVAQNSGAHGAWRVQNASLRLLCSITGGTLPAQWEDITGSTPLSTVKDCVSFTTTVSARFWLMDYQDVQESTDLAGRLYNEAILVPYMGKVVIFTKRLELDEALIRCFCVTDDKVEKTLECQEGFELCAASPEVEVVDDRSAWLETAGNLMPVAKSGEQLRLVFNAFRENRLAFPVRMKDSQQEPTGKLAFLREPRTAPSDSVGVQTTQRPICTLEVNLGADRAAKAAATATVLSDLTNAPVGNTMSPVSCVYPQMMNGHAAQHTDEIDNIKANHDEDFVNQRWPSVYTENIIARSELDLLQVAADVGSDWPKLVGVLLPESKLSDNCTIEQLVYWINNAAPEWYADHQQTHGEDETGGCFGDGLIVGELRCERDRALAVLLAWREARGDGATGNELDRALRIIGRMDVVKSCMRDIQYVTEPDEQIEASRRIDDLSLTDNFEEGPTSIAATTTLMSGMEDTAALSPETDEPDHELIKQVASERAEHEPDQREPLTIISTEEDDWQSGSPPATTTSKQGGDPLLVDATADQILSISEETDIVRDSESMTGSLEDHTSAAAAPNANATLIDDSSQNKDMDESVDVDEMAGTLSFTSEQQREYGIEDEDDQLHSNADVFENEMPETYPLNLSDQIDGDQVTGQPLAVAYHSGGERPASNIMATNMQSYDELEDQTVETGEEPSHLTTSAHHGVVFQENA